MIKVRLDDGEITEARFSPGNIDFSKPLKRGEYKVFRWGIYLACPWCARINKIGKDADKHKKIKDFSITGVLLTVTNIFQCEECLYRYKIEDSYITRVID